MATDDLTTWANVQSYTGASLDDEDFVGFLITAASRWANNFTGRKLASRAYTAEDEDTLYNGDGSSYIMLRQTPVTEITSVHESTDRTFDATTLVDSGDYVYYPDTGQLMFTESLPAIGWQTIKVLYTAGYVLASIDDALENAIIMLVDFWYKSYADHRFGVQSTGVDDKRIVYEKGVPTLIKEQLLPYKRSVL